MSPDSINMKAFLFLIAVLLISGCQGSVETPTPTLPVSSPTAAATHTQTATLKPSATVLPPTPTETPIPFMVCSPLEEETFETLPQILQVPLNIPKIGKDDGHHGLDFAYYQRGDRGSIQGIEIYAILSGQTVLTLEDVNPYGYTILIETPLQNLPDSLQETLLRTYQPIPENVVYQGVCPKFSPPEHTGEMSLYHLYAHLEAPAPFQPGNPIACGERLGTVGNTGNSSNPHLHLETRLGPSGADISTMAFYEPTYSEEQRANYCLWRMSGHYQLFDPTLIWETFD
jgi:murein DD-endopeptidase MepM/ murein hydrolase activator NlpD